MVRLIVETTFEPPLTDEEHHRACAPPRPLSRGPRSALARQLPRARSKSHGLRIRGSRCRVGSSSYRSAGAAFERVWSTEVYRLNEPDVRIVRAKTTLARSPRGRRRQAGYHRRREREQRRRAP